MPKILQCAIFAVCLLFQARLLQADIAGTIHNRTTNKPSAGDDVVLLKLGEGMQERTRTRTDAQGSFVLERTDDSAEYIIRVLHQGVNYDQVVTGRTPRLQIDVYDAVARIPGLSGSMGIVQTESDGKFLKLTEMYAISNSSQPPVTQANPHNLTISLPPKASLDWAEVKGPGGIWTKAPLAQAKDGKVSYTSDFPLRPGETLFKFTYHLPYQGPTSFHLKLGYPIQKFAVVHPNSMSFKAAQPNTFSNPGIAGGLEIEQALKEPLIGEVPAFTIAGTGMAPTLTPSAKGATTAIGQPPPTLATPQHTAPAEKLATTPQPAMSAKQVWLIVGIGAILLATVIAFLSLSRRKRTPTPALSQPLLETLKEELFHLESERLKGAISEEEYTLNMQALHVGIQRALAKTKAERAG